MLLILKHSLSNWCSNNMQLPKNQNNYPVLVSKEIQEIFTLFVDWTLYRPFLIYLNMPLTLINVSFLIVNVLYMSKNLCMWGNTLHGVLLSRKMVDCCFTFPYKCTVVANKYSYVTTLKKVSVWNMITNTTVTIWGKTQINNFFNQPFHQ